ncbi:MAG: DUF2889 domain-containing protein [Alphaproteobacteria bacterium]
MPLSPPAARERLHDRVVECRGYRRKDGLWDIEGHLVDSKSYGFPNRDRGRVSAGEPVHEMWLRLTIDDDMVIHEAEAATDFGPYRICPDITPNFRTLKGLKIGPGFRRAAHAVVGGTKGCTHLVELLGPLATTAYQTLFSALSNRARADAESGQRPAMLDTCHAYASDSEVVRRNWPKFYTGPTPSDQG